MARFRNWRFAQEIPEVQWVSEHLHLALFIARPLVLGAIPIQFDPVPIRISQIQRLADPVVGRSIELQPGRAHPAQRVG